jgi:predicted N-acetyltransferase YhbS
MVLRRLEGAFDAAAVLALLRRAFAPMEGVIDPPSSLHRLRAADVRAQAQAGEVWVRGDPLVACMFLTPKPGALYLGKLAVEPALQGRGHGRVLVEQAVARARALGLPAVEVQVRVELTGNQAAFAAMGFAEVGRTAHAGFDRPTSVTMRRAV